MKILLVLILSMFTFTAMSQGPCGSPNPPSWCNGGGGGPCGSANPPSWCNNTSVPINNGLWVLIILGLGYGFYTIRKQRIINN